MRIKVSQKIFDFILKKTSPVNFDGTNALGVREQKSPSDLTDAFAKKKPMSWIPVAKRIEVSKIWSTPLVQCFFSSRNMCQVTLKIIYSHYLKKLYFLDENSLPKKKNYKKEALTWLSSKSTYDQSMPSSEYMRCWPESMWALNCCCSFSFARLMQSCSKQFSLKLSKP